MPEMTTYRRKCYGCQTVDEGRMYPQGWKVGLDPKSSIIDICPDCLANKVVVLDDRDRRGPNHYKRTAPPQ
jgi:hypothetical protein